MDNAETPSKPDPVEHQLGRQPFNDAVSRGAAMSRREAYEFALAETHVASTTSPTTTIGATLS